MSFKVEGLEVCGVGRHRFRTTGPFFAFALNYLRYRKTVFFQIVHVKLVRGKASGWIVHFSLTAGHSGFEGGGGTNIIKKIPPPSVTGSS